MNKKILGACDMTAGFCLHKVLVEAINNQTSAVLTGQSVERESRTHMVLPLHH